MFFCSKKEYYQSIEKCLYTHIYLGSQFLYVRFAGVLSIIKKTTTLSLKIRKLFIDKS